MSTKEKSVGLYSSVLRILTRESRNLLLISTPNNVCLFYTVERCCFLKYPVPLFRVRSTQVLKQRRELTEMAGILSTNISGDCRRPFLLANTLPHPIFVYPRNSTTQPRFTVIFGSSISWKGIVLHI